MELSTRDASKLERLSLHHEGGTTTLRVNLPALDPPGDAFQVDWYFSESLQASGARFVFGKLSAGRKSLVGVVEVTMSTGALRSVEEVLRAKDFFGTLKKYVDTILPANTSARSAEELDALIKPGITKEAAFVVSFVFMGFAESDAVMSLYRLPPGAEVQARGDLSRIPITPLVRLDLPTPILWQFCVDATKYLGAES